MPTRAIVFASALGLFPFAVAQVAFAQTAAPQAPPAQPAQPAQPAAPADAKPDLAAAMEAFGGALTAKDNKDFAAYRAGVERAVELLPDPARLLYRLAAARLLAGDAKGAVDAYRRQVDSGLYRDPRKDPELAALLPDPAFQEALVRLDALKTPVVASTVAFELPARDLVEGLAHDPKTGAWFFSSVAQRKIYRRAKDGTVTDFVPSGASGLLSALGIAVDAEHRRLWVISAGLPQAADLKVSDRDKSALFVFDLDSGAWKQTFDAPPGGHVWNDLELAADGSVFVSDTAAKAIVRVKPDGGIVTLLAGEQYFSSPGGLALSGDGKLLYVADWSNGLGVLDLTATGSAAWTWLRAPAGSSVLGIDGLRRRGNRLLAIQNGVAPARIVELELAADGRSLLSAKTLERNVPEWDEPTLGTVVDGAFFYVANSHWPSFPGDPSAPTDTGKLSPTSIRRLPLD